MLFLARFGISAHYSFFSLFLRDSLGLANVSGIWALGSLAEAPMILFSGWIIARFGVRAVLTTAVAAVTVRLALYGLFPTLAVVVPAQLLHAFTFGALHTASVAYVNAKIDPSRRGLGMALYNALSVGLASFLASSAGGYLLEAAGFRVLFLVYAAVPVLGLAVLALRGGKLFALPSRAGGGYTRPMRKMIQQYAKDLTAGRLASGYEHSFRVYHLTREIGEGLDYDDDILHAACFLHDVEMSVGHPRSSAEKAEAILHETGFVPDKIPRVTEAILNHMPNGKPVSVEAKLLFDANLLDSIGAVGFVRLAVGGFLWYHFKTMPEIVDYLRRELSHTDRFNFPRSRELAVEKIAFTRAALEQFERELKL